MALLLDPEVREHIPLATGEGGAVRVGGTRVPLETVIDAFRQGDSAEEIAAAFSVLALADVYAVLTYYLRHRAAVDQYVEERRWNAADLRARLEAEFGTQGLRERLLARRTDGAAG